MSEFKFIYADMIESLHRGKADKTDKDSYLIEIAYQLKRIADILERIEVRGLK